MGQKGEKKQSGWNAVEPDPKSKERAFADHIKFEIRPPWGLVAKSQFNFGQSPSINHFVLLGLVCNDVHLYRKEGENKSFAVMMVRVAPPKSWKTSRKVKIDLILWDRLADAAAAIVEKGHYVLVTGHLHQSKKYRTYAVVDELTVLNTAPEILYCSRYGAVPPTVDELRASMDIGPLKTEQQKVKKERDSSEGPKTIKKFTDPLEKIEDI